MKLLALMVALPLLTAFLLSVINSISTFAARWAGPVVLLVTAAIGLSAWPHLGDTPQAVQWGGFQAPLGITLYADQLALLFALAITIGALLLWPGRGEDRTEEHPDDHSRNRLRRASLALLLAGTGSGLALSGDLFNIYVFYELLTVVSYGLIAGRGTSGSFAATLRYLVISGFGAALALAGIALVYQAAGTLNLAQLAQLAPERLNNSQGFAAFVLMLIGFGVKAELFPVNFWVPEVYATASSRVSALLAGVVSKLALLIIMRLLILVFHQPEALTVLLVLGVLGVASGELAAWRARDVNRLLAFSSIGQLGVMFIALSIPGNAGVLAALAVAVHHLFLKPSMFLLAERWGGSIKGLAGAAKTSPLGAALFVLLALSLIGVPPLPGFWAKLLVIMPLLALDQPLYYFAAFIVLAAAALEANYLFRVVLTLYDKAPAATPHKAHATVDLATAVFLGAGLVAAVFMLAPLAERFDFIAAQATDVSTYIQTVAPLSLESGSVQ